MGLILWAAPLSAILIMFLTKTTKAHHIISVLVSVIEVAVTWMLTYQVMVEGQIAYGFVGKLFYLDAFSIILLNLVVIVGMLAAIYNIGYLNHEKKNGEIDLKRIRLFYMLLYGFIFTMVFALTVNNMGLMWIAVEAITLASTFLVGFHNDKKAIEAAWKYVIICSVGIAIAMLGIVFLHISSLGINEGAGILDWTTLYDNADKLNGPVLRFAFIFIFIGFGTKTGLAPMHTWLPDAHSQAPSTVSALLSGVLLNSAMYAIIRTLAIVNKNLGDNHFTGRIMIGFGLLSIATAAVFILTQKDYKRLLAYSSIEHMGIIALALGLFTPLSVFAALFHMINHSFTKTMLFLASGSILQKYGTREISKIQGLLKVLPFTGTAFLLGLFAISGTPPFSVFASEFNVFISIFAANNFLLGVVFIFLLALIFVGIAVTLFKVFYRDFNMESLKPGETNIPGAAVTLVLLVIISVSGLYMPDTLKDLITAAQRIIIGGI